MEQDHPFQDQEVQVLIRQEVHRRAEEVRQAVTAARAETEAAITVQAQVQTEAVTAADHQALAEAVQADTAVAVQEQAGAAAADTGDRNFCTHNI